MNILEDEKIVDLYWERSEDAISETDKKYRNRCLYIARNILKDISDAEECLNDTYLTAWNLMPPDRPVFLSSFLFRIIKNHSLNRYSYLHREKRNSEASLSWDELGECIDGGDSADDKLNEKELIKALNDFLYSLDNDKRFVFIRRYWYMDSMAAIAVQCSKSEDNVKKILERVRKKLKDYLVEKGFY